jgi:SAM-dependent methyltransferase
MLLQSQSPFDHALLRDLLNHELAALAPECAGVFGRHGLFIGCDGGLSAHISTPMLGRRTGLHVAAPDQLAGDLRCGVDELPFGDESFRLVVLQHVLERIADPRRLCAEVVRVLEPGGVVMITGFAAWGVWRPLLSWLGRRLPPLHYASAWSAGRALARSGVDVYAQRRVGPPRIRAAGARLPLPAPLRPSWLLLARKRNKGLQLRAHPVALRPRGVRARLASGAQRARA